MPIEGGLAFLIERRKRIKKTLTLSIITFISIFLIGTILVNAGGKPFEALQKQINEINERLDRMQPMDNVEVYDFEGQLIGHFYSIALVGTTTATTLSFFIPELDAFAEFYPDGGIKGGNDWIDYSEYDCTGDAYRYIKDQGEIKMLKTFGYRYFI